jgi:hypothetical protein
MSKQKDAEMVNELKKLAQAMNEAYEEDNIINEFCTIKEAKGNNEEFIQMGQRINLPKEFFEKEEGVHKDNTILARDFIRSLVHGEEDFILREIISSNKVRKLTLSNFDYEGLSKLILTLQDPTDIFLPLEPYFKKVHYMAFESPEKIKFITGVGPILMVAGRDIKIRWITSHQEINKIIIINKRELKVAQESFDEAETPKYIKPIKEYDEFNKGNKLMLYFGEKDEKNFDFVFRTIISKPELNENSALVVETKNE